MNESENIPVIEESSDLKSEVDFLRQQVWVLLVLAVVVSGTILIYLIRQDVIAKRDLADLKLKSAPIIEQHQKDMPGIQSLMTQLIEYSRTHPDYTPILTKYGMPPAAKK
jgi:hypothetical protein